MLSNNQYYKEEFKMPGEETITSQCPMHLHSKHLPKVQHHQEEGHQRSHDDTIPPLPRADLRDDSINTWDLTSGVHSPPIQLDKPRPLVHKIRINRISLPQRRVRNIIRMIYSRPLIEHILRLGTSILHARRGVVCIDIVTYGVQEVGAVPRLGDGRLQPRELPSVVGEGGPVQCQILEFGGRRVGGGFGIEEAGQRGDDCFALREDVGERRFGH